MTGRDAACRECGRNEAAEDGQHHLPIGLAMGSVERASHARDRGRRSELVTSVIASVGRSDAGSYSDGGIDVRQGVAALVANGNGADAGSAHGMRGSSRGGEVRQGRDGRTRGRAIVIAAGDAAMRMGTASRSPSPAQRSVPVLRGERPPTVRSTGRDAMPRLRRGGTGVRARAAQARMRRAAMRGGGTAKRGEPIAAEAATGS